LVDESYDNCLINSSVNIALAFSPKMKKKQKNNHISLLIKDISMKKKSIRILIKEFLYGFVHSCKENVGRQSFLRCLTILISYLSDRLSYCMKY